MKPDARRHKHWFYGFDAVDLEELNIVEFPMAVLARHVPNGQKVITFADSISDRETGERLQRTLTISANAESDLPNWWDQDVLIALQTITNRKHGFSTPVVEFSMYEVLKLMGLADTGDNYLRLAKSLDNWQGVRFKYSHFRKGDSWLHPKAFCLIQDYDLTRKRGTGQRRPEEPQVFTWSRLFFESVQSSQTKPFDADFYFGLKLPTTKRLFRFLDKRLYRRPTYTYPLVPFCTEKLGLAGKRKPSQYPEKLRPAYDELVATGFLGELPDEKRFTGTRNNREVCFRRGGGRKNKSVVSVPLRVVSDAERILVGHGCSEAKLRELVEDGSVSREQLALVAEWYEWELRRGTKIPNAGGWIFKAVKEGWKPPKDFKSKSQREAEAKARTDRERRAQEAKAAEERAKKAETAAQEKKLHDFLDSLGSDEAREKFEERAVKNATSFLRQFYLRSKKEGGSSFEMYREIMLREEMERELKAVEEEGASSKVTR